MSPGSTRKTIPRALSRSDSLRQSFVAKAVAAIPASNNAF